MVSYCPPSLFQTLTVANKKIPNTFITPVQLCQALF